MKTKIYLGEKVPSTTTVEKQKQRYKLEFYGNPSSGTTFDFDIVINGLLYYNISKITSVNNDNIVNYIKGSTVSGTTSNLLTNLEIYNIDDNITFSLSPSNNGFGYKDIYVDVIGLPTDSFSILINVNTTSAINLSAPTFVNYFDELVDELVDNYEILDLFSDENIEFTSKLSDIEKLSNVFTDFTNSFNLPATPNNNALFKHYYDVDINNTFNPNIRVLGYIEIDSFPFRFGKIQLESIKLKNQKPDSYKISFYGNLIQLSDLFGDDTIDRLDYLEDDLGIEYQAFNSLSKFDYIYNGGNLINSINLPTFGDGDIITPLISYTDRDWNYGDGSIYDISSASYPVLDTELRPSIRLIRIMEAIEVKYGINFTRDFLDKAIFKNLFMWMNNQEVAPATLDYPMIITNPFIGINDFNWITYTEPFYNMLGYDFVPATKHWRKTYIMDIIPDDSAARYDIKIYDQNDTLKKQFIGLVGTQSIKYIEGSQGSGSRFRSDDWRNAKRKFVITPYNQMTGVFNIRLLNDTGEGNTVYSGASAGDITSSNNPFYYTPSLKIENNIPKIKVSDFISGIMKMFKLIIRPINSNNFYLDTLNHYYDTGNILDITQYVNQKNVEIDRPEIFKTLVFKYEKTDNILGKTFRETNDPINKEIGYGDLKSIYQTIENKKELKVELPFENMLFESLTQISASGNNVTNIVIGQAITSSDNGSTFSKNKANPILFYNNGITSHTQFPIKLKYQNTTIPVTYTYNVGNSDDKLLNQVNLAINWGEEIDPWHLEPIDKSLYKNYWENWVETIYDLKQRKFSFEANLPPRYIEELSLNDRLIIGSNRYKINDYKINLLNGKTKLTLFNDIYEWDESSFGSNLIYNQRAFGPNGWYMTDTIDNSDSAFIYGSFNTYDGDSYGKIIKLLPNGDVDTTFDSGTGFNSNLYGFQSIVKQTDGKILATGDFTSYNGTSRNRIIRLNTDGTIDSTFTVGTGFNSFTSGIDVDTQGRIVVCGSYGSYSGYSANRIIRLASGGTVDNTFVQGTGFNDVTNSVVINPDNSMYVGGYFTSYNGTSSNHIIKLTTGGTIDTTFSAGTGLNSSGVQTVGLIPDTQNEGEINNNTGVYVYGYFTQYSGQSANRICRLNSDGSFNGNFITISGFNNTILSGYKVMSDKLLLFGTYTEFNGLSTPNGLIVLNGDGSIFRTFSGNYVNVFAIGNRFYGNLTNGVTELIADETIPLLSRDSITLNAGMKYYDIDILKEESWTVTAIDLGDDADWVTIFNTSGNGKDTCHIRIEEKASQTPPSVYQPRSLDLLFNFNGIYRSVRINQNGLDE